MVLTLENSVTKRLYSCVVEDMGTSRDYYVLEGFILPEGIPDGDYNYTLTEDETVLSNGVMRIGDYVPEGNRTYKSKRMEYIYYQGK